MGSIGITAESGRGVQCPLASSLARLSLRRVLEAALSRSPVASMLLSPRPVLSALRCCH